MFAVTVAMLAARAAKVILTRAGSRQDFLSQITVFVRVLRLSK
jgi:hypothetical protein